MAVAGVLVTAPQAQQFVAASHDTAAVSHEAVTASHDTIANRVAPATLDAVFVARRQSERHYAVQSGDTLSAVAQRFYGQAGNWPWLYDGNRSEISDPNLIYPGEVLTIPSTAPAVAAASASVTPSSGGYQPRHARGSSAGTTAASSGSESAGGASSGGASSGGGSATGGLSGTLSCGGLEQLWVEAGGSASEEVIAASIAMAESGGNQYATGSVGERGYWQINPVNGSLSTYDPYGNARAAVIMSQDGADWSPWTTWTSGAYQGRC
jgi:LysM repeat protein